MPNASVGGDILMHQNGLFQTVFHLTVDHDSCQIIAPVLSLDRVVTRACSDSRASRRQGGLMSYGTKPGTPVVRSIPMRVRCDRINRRVTALCCKRSRLFMALFRRWAFAARPIGPSNGNSELLGTDPCASGRTRSMLVRVRTQRDDRLSCRKPRRKTARRFSRLPSVGRGTRHTHHASHLREDICTRSHAIPYQLHGEGMQGRSPAH